MKAHYKFDKLSKSFISSNYEKIYRNVFSKFGYKTNLNFGGKIKLIQRVAYKYITEIKKFTDTNLYIHSSGWSNI